MDITEEELKAGIQRLSVALRHALVDPSGSPGFIDKTAQAIRRLEELLTYKNGQTAREHRESDVYKTADALLGRKLPHAAE